MINPVWVAIFGILCLAIGTFGNMFALRYYMYKLMMISTAVMCVGISLVISGFGVIIQ